MSELAGDDTYVEVRHGTLDHVILVRSGPGRVVGVLGLLDAEWQSLVAIVRAEDAAGQAAGGTQSLHPAGMGADGGVVPANTSFT